MTCECVQVDASSCTGYATSCMANIGICSLGILLPADWHASPASSVGYDALAASLTLVLSEDLEAQGTLSLHTSAPVNSASSAS